MEVALDGALGHVHVLGDLGDGPIELVEEDDDLSLVAGSVYTTAPTQDIDLEEISGDMLSLDIGAAWDLGKSWRMLFVFSEDLITESAPDFTVTAAWVLSL